MAFEIKIGFSRKQPRPTAEQADPTKSRRKKRVLIFFFLVALIVITAAVLLLVHSSRPLPGSVTSQAKFTQYYPHKLPDGYTVNSDSGTYRMGALTYRIEGPQSAKILVSEQREPKEFDFKNFLEKGIKEKQTVETQYGAAYVGTSENTRVASLVADDVWVFLSAPQDVSSEQLGTVLKTFRKR